MLRFIYSTSLPHLLEEANSGGVLGDRVISILKMNDGYALIYYEDSK